MFVNVKEAAKKLGVCQQTIRRLAKNGKIEFIKISASHFLYNIDHFIEQQTLNRDK
jgi:excisionase family DNA binding protein